jgi:UrcA family protein
MASKGDTHKGDTHSDDGHSGGDDHGSGKSGAQPAKKAGGGNAVVNVLRSPVTWALAGVGALAAVVFSGVIPSSPTVETQPASYSSPDSSTVAESDADVSSPSQPNARRTARLDARECHSIVQGARADYGRDWERELASNVRNDCARTIQEARWVDRRQPLQVEAPRTQMPGAGDAEVVRVSVAYGDLDLSTPAGAERVLDRVRRAAIEACGGQPDPRDLAAQRPFKECVARSMDGAVGQLRAPRVTALHRQAG